jgi:hypothetical protein
MRTLDEVGLAGVRFVKADVEGGEREVLDGARATIARDRPIILLELLSGTHETPSYMALGVSAAGTPSTAPPSAVEADCNHRAIML